MDVSSVTTNSPDPLFEIITQMEWARFDPYLGVDFDFPTVLWELCHPDPNIREETRDFISAWPYAGYGRIGAMPDVIRCMISIFHLYPYFEDRAALLNLITDLVESADEYTHFTKWYAGEQSELITAIQDSFATGVEAYGEALSAFDPGVRAEAATALGLVGSREYVPLLLSRLEEEGNSAACQAILSALGKLGAPIALPIVRKFLNSSDPEIKLHAAGAVCQITRSTPDDAFHLLVDLAMLGTDPSVRRSKTQDRKEGHLAVEAILILQRLGEETLGRAVDQWIARLPEIEDRHLIPFMERILAWSMRQGGERRRSDSPAFTPIELKALRTLAVCSRFWAIQSFTAFLPWDQRTTDVNAERDRCRCLGGLYELPTTQEGVRRLVTESTHDQPVR